MPLTTGTLLGGYGIVSTLGVGGMGEVYRARDTKLGRSVAVKVIQQVFASDPDRVARFEREAKVLASLNHPHIAALYEMEQSGGQHFLVMELVEGETLAERLQRGPIPLEDVLKVALQITDAIEAAHEKGVVHRDLKPANVKITPDEKVKVLDFGLAKAMERESDAGNVANSPTLSMMATSAGIILGTAAYMSPEQAKGFPADHRSDIFSFGVVLYEMLTGRQPFQGETAPDVLASVLIREPELARLTPDLNPRVSELLRRCLEKSPKRRWQAIGDVRAEIEMIAAAPRALPATSLSPTLPRPLWRRAIPVALTAVIAAALGAWAMWTFQPATRSPVSRFAWRLPEPQVFGGPGRHIVAISPDGSRLAYVAGPAGLYIRSLAEPEPKPIDGNDATGTLTNPVFSPDGLSIAFFAAADQTLKRASVAGGTPTTLCAMANPFGMHWGDRYIYFGQGNKGIMRVSENGGKSEVLVPAVDQEVLHGPQLLPDGEHLLFTVARDTGLERWDKARIVVQSLKSGQRTTVIDGGSDARYVSTGHLLYAVGGTVFGIAFDARRMQVTGARIPVIEGVRRSGGAVTGAANFDVSRTGSVVYIPGPAAAGAAQLEVAQADRKGAIERLNLPPAPYGWPRMSRDGKRLAVTTDDAKEAIIWTYELSGARARQRLTFGGNNRFPVWSPDGKRIVFQSDRGGDLALYWQPADGTGSAERLTKPESGTSHTPESWSPRGDVILFRSNTGPEGSLWTLSLGDKKIAPFGGVRSSDPTDAVFSPDGRWVAYDRTDQGATRIYVQPFPATGGDVPVVRCRISASSRLGRGRHGDLLQSRGGAIRGRQRHGPTYVRLRQSRRGAEGPDDGATRVPPELRHHSGRPLRRARQPRRREQFHQSAALRHPQLVRGTEGARTESLIPNP